MKNTLIILGAIFLSSIIIFSKCMVDQTEANAAVPNQEISSPASIEKSKVERGAYLVNGMGCDDCHSPKKMGPQGPEVDPELRMSGHPADQPLAKVNDPSIIKDYALFAMSLTAAVGPWGTSYAANLTPDETGIGTWTEEQFLKAIREGKLKGMDNTRPLLPPMPWFMYKNLNDDDLKSIFAYLKTLKPVKNVVPAPAAPMM